MPWLKAAWLALGKWIGLYFLIHLALYALRRLILFLRGFHGRDN